MRWRHSLLSYKTRSREVPTLNLFLTSNRPVICARDLDDRRLISTMGEMKKAFSDVLCTNMRSYIPRLERPRATYLIENVVCDEVYNHRHPVPKWLSYSHSNFIFGALYLYFLGQEYAIRFSARVQPNYANFAARTCLINLADIAFNVGYGAISGDEYRFHNQQRGKALRLVGNTRNFVPDDLTVASIIGDYRAYLKYKWRHSKELPRFTNANPPSWMNEDIPRVLS